jgi:hypothetical protein
MADDGTGFLSGFAFNVIGQDAIGAAVGVAGAVAAGAAASAGGGFTMSKDEMTAMLTKAQATQNLISEQMTKARNIAVLDPPGDDDSSKAFTQTAIDSGRYYLGHLNIQYNRYGQLIKKLKDALDIHDNNEQQAAQAIQAPGAEGMY